MATYNKIVPDERLQRSQADTLVLKFRITGTGSARQVYNLGAPVVWGFKPADLSQSTVDGFLSPGEINCAMSFGAVALGANSFGFVLAHGTARKAIGIRIDQIGINGTNGNTAYAEGKGSTTTESLANTQDTSVAVTTKGNIYGRYFDNTSKLNLLNDGYLIIEIDYE